MEIGGQVVVVTGAGSGLGAAVARHFASLGAKVACIDLSATAAEETAAAIGGLAVAADVSDLTAVEAGFARIGEVLGVPRVAVSCAGIVTAARILPRDGLPDVVGFERTLRVNLTGTFTVMSVAARGMAAAQPLGDEGARGVIVNTASIAYEDGQIGQTAYAASKGGVASMTLPAARELARHGIRVMAIAPGLFETAMAAGLPEETKAEILRTVPYPSRLGDPEEFAALVQHIVENPMLNGSVIRLDAAARMPIK